MYTNCQHHELQTQTKFHKNDCSSSSTYIDPFPRPHHHSLAPVYVLRLWMAYCLLHSCLTVRMLFAPPGRCSIIGWPLPPSLRRYLVSQRVWHLEITPLDCTLPLPVTAALLPPNPTSLAKCFGRRYPRMSKSSFLRASSTALRQGEQRCPVTLVSLFSTRSRMSCSISTM